jgi:hypothetical protein
VTLEQLESNGWTRVATDTNYYVAASKMIDYRWIEIGYDIPNIHLQVLKVHQHPAGFKTRETIYNGKCADIETFKYLQTLLEI